MGPVTYVEILYRHGRLRERHRLDTLPATLGRAYDCNVLVDDEFVSPHHLRLEKDTEGALIAVDLESRNGAFALHPLRRISHHRLTPETELQIGRTILRVRTYESSVPEAKPDSLGESRWARWLESGLALSFTFIIMVVVVATSALVPDYSDQEPLRLAINEALPLSTALFFWVGMWSTASRISTHRFFFVAHCHIAATFTIVVSGLALLQQIWHFSMTDSLDADQSFAAV